MRFGIPALLLLLPAAPPLAAQPVVVGKYAAKIVPEQASVLNLPEKGTVTDLADDSRRLEKGTVIAVLNKEQTKDDREDMELQIARERITKRDEVQKLRAQRRKIEFYLSLTEGERKYNTDFQEKEATPTAESLQDIDERLSLLERELQTMERRKRTEFSRKHDNWTLRMPFDGRLQYNVTLPEDRSKPFEAIPGNIQNFATVCDDSAFYITVSIANSDLSVLPERNFSAYVKLPGGRRLEGVYAKRSVERNGASGDMLVYYFKLAKEDHDTAFSMLGSNATAYLAYETEEETQMVSKSELVARPEAAECESWQQLAERAYPGYSVLLVAERHIVLCKNKP